MKRFSNPYPKIFKTHLISGFAYRGAALSGICTQVFWGFMQVLLFSTLYKLGGATTSFTYPQMCTYIWLQQSFMSLFYMAGESKIIKNIMDGGISYELVRPIRPYWNWFFSSAAGRVSRVLLRALPILILGFALIPAGIGMSLPGSVGHFFLFLLTLVTSMLLSTAISMFLYILIMKTLSDKGVKGIMTTVSCFLSGFVVPIPLMPKWLQTVMSCLPFRYVNDLCFQTYIGSLSISQVAIQIAIQIGWIILLVLLGWLWLRRCLKKVEVQGG